MSRETVNSAIRFWTRDATWNSGVNAGVEFSLDEQNAIRESLHQLYVGSEYAQTLLEGAVSGGKYISFVQTDPDTPGEAVRNSGIAGVNLSAIRHAYMLNSKGDLLAPGMAVTVEIKTGTRRIIEYLMSPLLRYKQESLRER